MLQTQILTIKNVNLNVLLHLHNYIKTFKIWYLHKIQFINLLKNIFKQKTVKKTKHEQPTFNIYGTRDFGRTSYRGKWDLQQLKVFSYKL